MGKYAQGLSERALHVKIDQGYCLICGYYGRLTADHVPPSGAITITKTEQRHITEALGPEKPLVSGVKSRNGSKFRTICETCNRDKIGSCDQEVAQACKDFTGKIREYFFYANSPFNTVHTSVKSLKYARAMIGHILSATSSRDCESTPADSQYFSPLREFVLGNDHAIDKTHDIYYWFYPFNYHLSLKCGHFHHNGSSSLVSLLSFFPVAFLVTESGKGVYPSHAQKLSLDDCDLALDLSSRGTSFAAFPFIELKGDQMLALQSSHAIMSYPKGR